MQHHSGLLLDERVMSDLTASGLDFVPNAIHMNRDTSTSWNNNSYIKQFSQKPNIPLSSTKSHKKVMFKLPAEEKK